MVSGRGMLRRSRREALESEKMYRIFMVSKPFGPRLLANMENMNINCESWKYSLRPALFSLGAECKWKRSVDARNHGDVVIVHRQGRIVYRAEEAALSRVDDQV